MLRQRETATVVVQVQKVLQLDTLCSQRMGIILMGPSGAGKTTLWSLLSAAYSKLGSAPIVHKLNPKAVTRQQLLGSLDAHTRCVQCLHTPLRACVVAVRKLVMAFNFGITQAPATDLAPGHFHLPG